MNMMGFLYLHRLKTSSSIIACALIPTIVSAELYSIPNANPDSYSEVENVIKPGSGEIPKNLEEAMCGGWDLGTDINGMFGREERMCPPSADEPLGARCKDTRNIEWTKVDDNTWRDEVGGEQSDADMDRNAKLSDPSKGLISNVKGVPGRENAQVLGNIRSGLGLRTEEGGDEDISGHPPQKNGETSGFVYPKDTSTVCGFSTVCRTSEHPDRRTVPPIRTDGDSRDGPPFFCEHPCQRPLDTNGKPGNWDPENSDEVDCGSQEYYEPKEDKIKYACGGGETKGPGEGFCSELQANGPLGGLCEDMNTYIYILYKKSQGECVIARDPLTGIETKAEVFLWEKGKCGFPGELASEKEGREADPTIPGSGPGADPEPNPEASNGGGWQESGRFECCSDDPYNPGVAGESCITCTGEDCRVNPKTNNVIINDAWATIGDNMDGSFPNNGIFPDGSGGGSRCIDEPNRHAPQHQRTDEIRTYISFFRDYNEASYERAKMDESGEQPDGSQKEMVKDDDNKKEKIPVACYGLYDLSPEDAKYTATAAKDKHCSIGAYYENVNFWEMKETQKGKGFYLEKLPPNPFNDPLRPFDEDNTLWFPELGSAFSMINDKVFSERMDNNLTFTILAPDSAKQRATVQLDAERPFSSGSLIRAFDDTVTNDFDYKKDRRSVTEWWQAVETEMHEFFSPPIIRLLLATTWSIDLDPLDPIYTPPVPPRPEDEAIDPRSETIEVQIEAREDLLGDVIAYMERARLLRIEGEPIPIVVPIGNPTELRIIAHGWEIWAKKQDDNGGPGGDKARKVAEDLLKYAERMDDVRKLRAQLPRYAGALLEEQKVISKKLAEWLTQNIDAYNNYVNIDAGMQLADFWWKKTQDTYREMHNSTAFPWCRNDRFTTPIYSLLDPWMPTDNIGPVDPKSNPLRDVTGGFLQYDSCFNDLTDIDEEGIDSCSDLSTTDLCFNTLAPNCGASIFDRYAYCINTFADRRADDGAEFWPSIDVCNEYLPMAPNFPFLEADREPDIILDFTAFREPPKTIKLPVLKPTQIRMDFTQIRPPAMENNDEPSTYPELPELPEIPEQIADQVFDSLPNAIVFKEAPVLTINGNDDVEEGIPEIKIPETDITGLTSLLMELHEIITGMADENEKFWKSVSLEKCEEGRGDDCVAPGTEQDCVEPYDDPKHRCVHFEGDLKERLQRIGSRPAILVKDDYLSSSGQFRDPITHGQENCERSDWVCQLLNARNKKPREGWMVDVSEDYDPEQMMLDLRKTMREQTQNIFDDPEKVFPYDFPQEQIFEIFRLPEGEHIDRRIESVEGDSSESESSNPTTR